jgi:formate/nitrite transporter FocA (FNT family)
MDIGGITLEEIRQNVIQKIPFAMAILSMAGGVFIALSHQRIQGISGLWIRER